MTWDAGAADLGTSYITTPAGNASRDLSHCVRQGSLRRPHRGNSSRFVARAALGKNSTLVPHPWRWHAGDDWNASLLFPHARPGPGTCEVSSMYFDVEQLFHTATHRFEEEDCL